MTEGDQGSAGCDKLRQPKAGKDVTKCQGRRPIEGVCGMTVARNSGWKFLLGTALVLTGVIGIAVPRSLTAQSSDAVGDVTYTKDIAPILQRSCENCHRADGVAPMSLSTYEE